MGDIELKIKKNNYMEKPKTLKEESLLINMADEPQSRSNGGSFCQQLRSTMKLNFIQRLRSPISSILEFLIPIIFIVGTVILYVVMSDKITEGEDFVNYNNTIAMLALQQNLTSTLCYNSNVTESIGDLPACVDTLIAPSCFNEKSGISVNGLCMMNTMPLQMFFGTLFILLKSYDSNVMPIPSFDDVVKLQWLAKGIASLDKTYKMSGSIMYSGKLFLSPKDTYTESFVTSLNQSSTLFKYVFGGYFISMDEMDNYFHDNEDIIGNWGAIHVKNIVPNPVNPSINVVIRLNASSLPSTANELDRFYDGGQTSTGGDYFRSGFLTLQKEVYNHFITSQLGIPTPPTSPLLLPMGTVDAIEKVFLSAGGAFLPLMVVLGFLYPVSQSTKRIVLDKELRIKEALLIMGLRQSVQYISWFFIACIQYAVVSLIIAIIMKFTFMKNSEFFSMFFLFFVFSLTIVALSGLFASVFSKARIAAILSPLFYFILATPLFAVGSASSAVISGLCIFSPSAFAQGITLLFNYEISTGFQTENFTSPYDKPNMIFIFFMMVLDLIVYLLLMLYLDAVVPNDWGTPKHPFFCIIALFKCCCRRKEELVSEADGRNPNGVFEPLTSDEESKASVNIIGLTKSFKRGKETFLAVDHMHLSLIEGEISVLLGHNGAGKSTTINMMTGMLKPNSGDCHIYGNSIRENLSAARQEIGFCPQHNILWPDLTCREHLEYFSSIKGLSGKEQKRAINNMLDGVDLQDKRNYASSALSGGQKRKLSVAIAFVGSSRLIFLDEPTAGMDVEARRHTWELLRQMSSTRTILLSTHFMDEADLLGDRIAIMSAGRLQCAGSSVFLKSNLGVGYNITMSVNNFADRCAIATLIKSYVPPAEIISSSAGEISFRLPMAFVSTFASMLRDIEESREQYGIQNYSLSATTLEEIFLRIAHGEDFGLPPVIADSSNNNNQGAIIPLKEGTTNAVVGSDLAHPLSSPSTATHSPASEPRPLRTVWEAKRITSESKLMALQFKASLLKRCLNALRDRRTQCIQIIFPVVMIIFAMLLNMINFITRPSLRLSSDMFEEEVQIDLGNCLNAFNTSIPFASKAEFALHNDISNTPGFSEHLIDTYKTHSLGRYTSMFCNDPSINGLSTLFYNMSAPHGAALTLVGYYGAMIQNTLSLSSVEFLENIFITSNFPMARTKTEEAFRDMMKAILVGMLIMIPFSFIPSTFVSWVVKERECKARHLQNVSGLRFSIYWLSNYLFDFCSYLIMLILIIIVLIGFRRSEYISPENFGPTVILFITYGLSSISMAYAVSFFFKEHSTAQNIVMLANFIAGFFLVLLVTILSLLPSTEKAGNGLRWAFRVFPGFCVGEGISNLAALPGQQGLGIGASSPWDLSIIGYPVIFMAAEMPIFFLITLFIDHPTRRMRMQMLLRRADAEPENIENEDDDVAEERRRVTNCEGNSSTDLVRVVNLRKIYGNGKVAVRNITFGVKPGEVFGFLGTNGAGKTTTISILCQEMVPTSGHAFVGGNDIVEESREALRHIGYCPQFDALLDLLTVEEHLRLYAGIRGVIDTQRESVVLELMQLCELSEYKNTRAGELSGGNRRKLSVALALVGGPRVVFLDEPSAGMDPVARRGLWTATQTISSACAVVLTTHHLEEVEALAHRVAIMVDGTLRCLGTKTHLKTKYGSGFAMTLRAREEVAVGRVEEFINECFPHAKLEEVRGQRYTYALPPSTKLSEAFGVLESKKEEVGITDYSVSQTSIEQVFLAISEGARKAAEAAALPEDQRRLLELL